MNQSKPKSSTEQNYNRACEACRLHKVRCLPNIIVSSKVCQRCAKTDRHCVFTTPQKRKQRKRTDTRVAELEREVQAMRALFDSNRNQAACDTRGQNLESSALGTLGGMGEEAPIEEFGSVLPSERVGGRSAGSSSTSPDTQNTPGWTSSPFSPDFDVVDRGVISMGQANVLFKTFNEHLVQHYPAVLFPPDLSAEELRRTKPTLFLAVIAAAAGKLDPHLYSILNSEVLTAYAHRTVINSEKSVELVQAMTVTSVWYFPPGKFSRLKFYEYIHMAATMAMDLGLGQNPRTSRSRRGGENNPSEVLGDADLERRRVFLVCYMITTGASMSMRRPNMLRYNSWIDECLETLADANVHPLDKTIVGWVRLLKITEDIHSSFSFDDLGSMVSLSETRVQLMVNGFEKALEGWRRDVESNGINDALLLAYHQTQSFVHELGIHDDHPPEDFTPPFRLTKIFTIQIDPAAKSTHIDAISACISNSHSSLDILLNMSIEELRSLPVFNFVRMVYSSIMLVKLLISSKSPQSKIGPVIDLQSLKVGFYLEAVVKKLDDAIGPMMCRAPYTFLGLMMRLHSWHKEQEYDQCFVPPTSLEYTTDICWLPPAPMQAQSEVLKGLANEYQALDSKEFDLSAGDSGNLIHTEEFQYEINNAMATDQFISYDGLVPTDPNLNQWMPDLNMPGMLDNNQVPEAYDWGFPITTQNKL